MILPVGRRFCNFNQAFQYVNMFVDKWGMVVSQKSGNHIFCYYDHKTTSEKKKRMVTLNERRNRVNVPKQIQCPWFMKFKCSRQSDSKISKEIDTNTNKRISSLNIPVEISEVMYLHGDKCHPGPDSQRYAKKNSGRYLMKENITKDSITLFNSGHIPSTTIREYIRHLCRVPTGVELSSSDLHNFKVRVNEHGCKILLSVKEQNRKKFWNSEPLDESELSIFGKLDNISESCSQLFQE